MKIAVIFPTRTEAAKFDRAGVDVYFCGVGVAASAYATAKIIKEADPDVLILAGIAGVYPTSGYTVGDTLLVKSECEADLGFFYDDGFRHISDMSLDMDFDTHKAYECPYISDDMPLPVGTSNTMNCAIAPFVGTEGVDIENMEGAGFFYACLAEGKRFFEVRSISNIAEPSHKDWDYDSSICNMTDGLNALIDYLEYH